MRSIHLKGRIGRALLAFSFVFGIAIVAGTTAQAQYQDRDGVYRRDDSREARRHRRERNREWRRNRRDRSRDDVYRDENVYRRDDRYGRNDGYYGGYGNNNNIYQAARNQGYQSGLNTGSRDAERGQSYNPQRSRYYKDAAEGYNSSYGNRGQYQQAYRDGFLRGYEEGYRQYGGYRRNDNNRGVGIGDILGGILGRP
jgi:hypothetical protein